MNSSKIPRLYHGAHRPDRAGHDFTSLYQEVTRRAFRPTQPGASKHAAKQLADADTEILPRFGAFILPIEQRLAELRTFPNVLVVVDPSFMPDECTWCPDKRRLTTVRVTGRPAVGELKNPLRQAEVCHQCALSPTGPVRQALTERDPATPQLIRIDVCE